MRFTPGSTPKGIIRSTWFTQFITILNVRRIILFPKIYNSVGNSTLFEYGLGVIIIYSRYLWKWSYQTKSQVWSGHLLWLGEYVWDTSLYHNQAVWANSSKGAAHEDVLKTERIIAKGVWLSVWYDAQKVPPKSRYRRKPKRLREGEMVWSNSAF